MLSYNMPLCWMSFFKGLVVGTTFFALIETAYHSLSHVMEMTTVGMEVTKIQQIALEMKVNIKNIFWYFEV